MCVLLTGGVRKLIRRVYETLNTTHGMLESMGHKDLHTTWRLNNTQGRCPRPCGPPIPEPTACWTPFSKCHGGTCTVWPILVISSTKRRFRVAISQDEALRGAWGHASYSPQFIGPTGTTWLYIRFPARTYFAQTVKSLPAMQETWVRPLGQEDPLEKEMATTPVFLPGKSHEWRRMAGYSPWGRKEWDSTERLTLSPR